MSPFLLEIPSRGQFRKPRVTMSAPFAPLFGAGRVRNHVCGAQRDPNSTTSGFILVFHGSVALNQAPGVGQRQRGRPPWGDGNPPRL